MWLMRRASDIDFCRAEAATGEISDMVYQAMDAGVVRASTGLYQSVTAKNRKTKTIWECPYCGKQQNSEIPSPLCCGEVHCEEVEVIA